MKRLLSLLLLLLILLPAVAGAHGSFDRKDFPQTLKSDHFTILYAKTGRNAVSEAYAKEVLTLAEESYSSLVTKGGLRPPRVLPVPVVLRGDDSSFGGSVSYTALGHDLYVTINPQMSDRFSLGDVVAHEFFHVLQTSYEKGQGRPDWAIEGTAPVAVAYAFDRSNGTLDQAMLGHLADYWSFHDIAMKNTKYMSSLFWYWMAEQYGNLAFIRRVLEWSEDVEFERAAQLAAIQGGAPADTTFDKLWRAFVLDMVDGKMPGGYQTERWWQQRDRAWEGRSVEWTAGAKRNGFSPLGYRYSFYEPLVLGPYSFQFIPIRHDSDLPFDLTVNGDQGTVEAYVVRPGPAFAGALIHYDKQPRTDHPLPPPSDKDTVGQRLEVDKPVRVEGIRGGYTVVVVLRTGHWGHGAYGLRLEPSSGKAPLPAWQSLAKLPHGDDSPGTPPPLAAEELAALRKGLWLTGTRPVTIEQVAQVEVKRLSFIPGSRTATLEDKEVSLPVAPMVGDSEFSLWVPAKALMEYLGGKLEGNRLVLGDRWIEATPGLKFVASSRGEIYIHTPARMENGVLMISHDFFHTLNIGMGRSGDTYKLVYPDPNGEE